MRLDIGLGIPQRPDDGEDPLDALLAGASMGAMLARMAHDYPDQMLARIKTDHGDGTYTCDRPGTTILMKRVPSNDPKLAEQLAVGMTVVIKFYNRDRKKPYIWRIAGGLGRVLDLYDAQWWWPGGNHRLQFTFAIDWQDSLTVYSATSSITGGGEDRPIVLFQDTDQWHLTKRQPLQGVYVRKSNMDISAALYDSFQRDWAPTTHAGHWGGYVHGFEVDNQPVGAILQLMRLGESSGDFPWPSARMLRADTLEAIGPAYRRSVPTNHVDGRQILDPLNYWQEVDFFEAPVGGNIVPRGGNFYFYPFSCVDSFQNYYTLTASGMEHEGCFAMCSNNAVAGAWQYRYPRAMMPYCPDSDVLFRFCYEIRTETHFGVPGPYVYPHLCGIRGDSVLWRMDLGYYSLWHTVNTHHCANNRDEIYITLIEGSSIKLKCVNSSGVVVASTDLWEFVAPSNSTEDYVADAAAQYTRYTVAQMTYHEDLEALVILYHWVELNDPALPYGSGQGQAWVECRHGVTLALLSDYIFLETGISNGAAGIKYRMVGGTDWVYGLPGGYATDVAVYSVPDLEVISARTETGAPHTRISTANPTSFFPKLQLWPGAAVTSQGIYGESLSSDLFQGVGNGSIQKAGIP